MVRRTTVVLVAMAWIVASCTGTTGTTTTTMPPVDRLVIATTEGSVVVYDDALDETTRWDPPEGSIYRQPTWIDSDTVLFSEVDDDRNHGLIAAGIDGEVEWRVPMETSPFFFAPAPTTSDYATTSLRNNPGADLISELVDRDGVVTEFRTESPFYTSWSPDGARIAANVPGRSLEVVSRGSAVTVLETSNGFQAPVWLDRGLVVLHDAGERFLSVWTDGTLVDVARLSGSAIFVGNGDRVAIKTTGPQGEDPNGVRASLRTRALAQIPDEVLVVVDLGTGTVERVTDEPTAAYQWDTLATRLLFGTASLERGITWHVWADGTSTELASFRPSPRWVAEFLPFFDQYAQSVGLWSATGANVAIPVTIAGHASVAVVPTDGGAPRFVDGGVWASWAP